MSLRFSDVFSLQMGKTPARNNPAYWGGTQNWISISDMNDKYISKTREQISDAAISETGIKLVPKGTVIMSFKLSIGKVSITAEDTYTNEAIMAFINKGIYDIDNDYLYHYLKAQDWSVGSNKAVKGSTLNKSVLEKRDISFPSKTEQQKISYKLNLADEAISRCRQIEDTLDQLIKSRFIEMFGDPVKNQHGYPLVSLSEYIDFLTSGSRGWAKYCVDDGDEWFITIKNVKNCRITTENMQSVHAPKNAEAQRTRVQEGDLLISITADLGRTGVVSKEIANHGAYINQHLSCIRLKKGKVLPLYVAYFMESPAGKMQFLAQNQSAVKAGLNFDSIKSLRLLAPPIKLQENFVSFIDEIDKSKLAVKECLEKAEYLKSALMQEYFG